MKNRYNAANFDELFSFLQEDSLIYSTIQSLYIANSEPHSIFEELLVQPMNRYIDGKEISFLAIRSVTLKHHSRGQGLFKHFVQQLHTLNIPILYHDVVNLRLVPFFENKGYQRFSETKYEQELISYYFLP